MSTKNEANKQIDAEEHAFELLNHYLFWEWQYCYRNDLLRKMISEKNIKVPGVERLVSADQYIKNIVTHWPPRIIERSMKDGLFDSERIILDTLNCRLKYDCPSKQRTIYHALVFEALDDENIEEISRDKGGLIPFDLSEDIDIAALELKLFYYTHVVEDRCYYEEKAWEIITELTEKKVKLFSGYKSFSKAKQDPPRAIGLFLWDYAFDRQFKRGSMSASFEMFSLFMNRKEIATDSIPLSEEILKSHYRQTHKQILTREVRPMSPPKSKKPAITP